MNEGACVHHWLISSVVVDGVYPARCRDCESVRTYPVVPREDVNAQRSADRHRRAHTSDATYLVRPI